MRFVFILTIVAVSLFGVLAGLRVQQAEASELGDWMRAELHFDATLHEVFSSDSTVQIEVERKEVGFYYEPHKGMIFGVHALYGNTDLFLVRHPTNPINFDGVTSVSVYEVEEGNWHEQEQTGFHALRMNVVGRGVLDFP